MTKAPMTFTLSTVLTTRLRQRAEALSLPQSGVAEALLEHAMGALQDDEIKQFVATRQTGHGGLTKDERMVLEALKYLTANEPSGAWRFAYKDIGRKAGITNQAITYAALQKLQTRGLVRCAENAEAGEDRWGRPVESYWNLPR